jgi:hypothetical protein
MSDIPDNNSDSVNYEDEIDREIALAVRGASSKDKSRTIKYIGQTTRIAGVLGMGIFGTQLGMQEYKEYKDLQTTTPLPVVTIQDIKKQITTLPTMPPSLINLDATTINEQIDDLTALEDKKRTGFLMIGGVLFTLLGQTVLLAGGRDPKEIMDESRKRVMDRHGIKEGNQQQR